MPHVKFKCDQQKNNMLYKSMLWCFVQPCYIALHVSLLINLYNATKQTAEQTLHCTNQNILLPFIFVKYTAHLKAFQSNFLLRPILSYFMGRTPNLS
jgi:flagellar biosynthesis protein FliQ